MRAAAQQRVEHRERVLQEQRDLAAAQLRAAARSGSAEDAAGRVARPLPARDARRQQADAAPARSATCRCRTRRRCRSSRPARRRRSMPPTIVRRLGCRSQAATVDPEAVDRRAAARRSSRPPPVREPLVEPVADQVHRWPRSARSRSPGASAGHGLSNSSVRLSASIRPQSGVPGRDAEPEERERRRARPARTRS